MLINSQISCMYFAVRELKQLNRMPGAAGEDSMVRSYLEWLIEIRLRGLVLPVGRIKEKVVAAARAGLTHVLLPARNRRDIEDVPASARERIDFRFIEHVDEAVAAALAPADGELPAATGSAEDAQLDRALA